MGVDLQRLLVLDDRFVHPALLEQSDAEVVVDIRAAGLICSAVWYWAIASSTLPFWSRRCRGCSGLPRSGIDLQRLLVLDDRFVHPALLEQGVAQVVVGFCKVGFDFQCLLAMGDRFVHPALLEQRVAEVVVKFRGSRV